MTRSAATANPIGVVVIGRNEGERLRACLASLQGVDARVYVDSGSTDGSRALAERYGFGVIELDLRIPFSAARARNEGIWWLLDRHPELAFVQTVDGDCEVRAGWLDRAAADLEADRRRAVVFGRRRERQPSRNAYHLACDDEWAVPAGAAASCGGDALLRIAALRQVGGYDPSLIAGEEPDMCHRLRRLNWTIWSNGAEMTWHDVAMDRMSQWWQRSRRAGFAFAQLADRHGADADPAWPRLVRSAQFWTLVNLAVVPGAAVAFAAHDLALRVIGLVPASLSAAQLTRMAASKLERLGIWGAVAWAGLIMTAKAAQVAGWLQYRRQQATGRRTALIEYKR